MSAVTIHSDFGAQENKICHYSTFLPSICHEVMRLGALILAFLLSSLMTIKRLFSSSLLSAIRMKYQQFAYLKLLIFLLAILTPDCDSSSMSFCLMYSACKYLFKQGDNIQPCHTPFSIWNQSVFHVWSNCCFLTYIPVQNWERSMTRLYIVTLFKNYLY